MTQDEVTVTLSDELIKLINQTREVNETPYAYLVRAIHNEAYKRSHVDPLTAQQVRDAVRTMIDTAGTHSELLSLLMPIVYPLVEPEVPDIKVVPVTEVQSVYCKYCHKEHAVQPGETECAPGAWVHTTPYTHGYTEPREQGYSGTPNDPVPRDIDPFQLEDLCDTDD